MTKRRRSDPRRRRWLRTGDEVLQQASSGAPDPGGPGFLHHRTYQRTIIRDGDKFSPLAIERRIVTELPEIQGRLVALGFPHDVHGEEIGLYIENEELGDELRAGLTKEVGEMPLDARPKIILYGTAPIPRTHTGKIQRRSSTPPSPRFGAAGARSGISARFSSEPALLGEDAARTHRNF